MKVLWFFKMLQQKIPKILLACFSIFQLGICKAEQFEELERKIVAQFEKLDTTNVFELKTENQLVFPLYESYLSQEILKNEKVASGALCREYFKSERLECLNIINQIYLNDQEDYYYNLIDMNGQVIYDIVRINCSGGVMINKVDTFNQKVIIELMESYFKWYEIVQEFGIRKVIEDNISPTTFTTFKWRKELGYCKNILSPQELLKRFIQIRSDSSYLNSFIKNQGLIGFNKYEHNTEIIDELAILSLMNNQNQFTHDVLKFKLVGDRYKPINIVSQLELNTDDFNLAEILTENNLSVCLSMY